MCPGGPCIADTTGPGDQVFLSLMVRGDHLSRGRMVRGGGGTANEGDRQEHDRTMVWANSD